MHRFFAPLFALLLVASPAARAQNVVVVKFSSFSNGSPGIPIESRVERKLLTSNQVSHVGITREGELEFHENNCEDAAYLLTPMSDLLVSPKKYFDYDWRHCDQSNPNIAFLFATTQIVAVSKDLLRKAGLSPDAISLLTESNPDSFLSSPALNDSYDIIRSSWSAGQIGVTAKTADHVAAILRKAGQLSEAQTLSEVAIGVTAVEAWTLAEAVADAGPTAWTDPLIVPSSTPGSAGFSNEALASIKQLQSVCGVPADGVVGWKTYGCLAGGSDFSLPASINNPVAVAAELSLGVGSGT